MSEIDAMDELPAGWTHLSFMDLFGIEGGTQPPKTTFIYEPRDGFVRLLQIRDFGEKPLATYIPDKGNLRKCVETDILIGRYGASVGRICTGMKGAYNVALVKVLIPNALDKRFVCFLLLSDLFQRPIVGIERSAQDGFNKGDLERIRLVLPPLAEQKRIVAKVEQLLARVNAARARLAKVPAILKRFRQAVLAAACCGRLTGEWRDTAPASDCAQQLLERILTDRAKRAPKRAKIEPVEVEPLFELPLSWKWTAWHDLVDWVTYGFTRPMPHVESGIPIVTAKNIVNSAIDFKTADFTTPEAFADLSDKDRPIRGEILLTKDGSIGRAAIVDVNTPFCINQSVAVLRFGGLTAFVPFLLRALEAPFTQQLIEEGAKGSAIRHISITAFVRFPVPLPPYAEQQEIVRRVEILFRLADAIEKRLATATARVEKLTQAILAKAFRGELVPTEAELARAEGRDYEPASVLLERIRTERAQSDDHQKRITRRASSKQPRRQKGELQ